MKSWLVCFFAVFTLILLTSCHSANQSLNKTWFFAYYAPSGETVLRNSPLTPENFIDLRKDGNYTSYLSGFDFGTWKREQSAIQVINHKGDKKVFKIISLKDEEMTLNSSTFFENGPDPVFTGISNASVKESDNPFSRQNNQWRIPPSRPETSEQIKNRLVNHFRFWEKYFEWAVNNDLKTVGVGSTNSPIKIYGNGFALIPYNELSNEWKKNFFDEGDCIIAWDKLKTMMNTKKVVWPKTDNRFKFFIAGFQQLQGMVE